MKKLAISLILTSFLIFTSCNNSSTNASNQTPPTLTAVIDHSPASPEVGMQVSLDATASQDDQNIGYDVNWSFADMPSGSSISITGNTQENASFTPDVAGEYVVELEISNSSENVSDSETATITVTPVEQSAIELSGTISSDSTLTDIFSDPSEPDYLVVGDLDIEAMLTIDPGVVIHVQQDLGIDINGAGILKADGETDNKIVITGENQSANGFWRGLNVYSNSVENSISNAEISYGGSASAGTYFDAAIITIDRAKLQMSGVTISHSGGYGIQTRRNESEFPMQNMIFEVNDLGHAYVHTDQMGYFDNGSMYDGGYVFVYSGDTSSDMDIANLDGAKYQIMTKSDFNHAVTIEPGTEFEFAADAGLDINGDAVIIAQGTASDKIVFTGVSKAPGAWKGIYIGSSSVDNILEHVNISYGGSSANRTYFDKTNLVIDYAKVILRNVAISGSGGYGIETRRDGSTFSVENSSFSDNAFSDMYIHPTQVGFIDDQTNFNGGDVEVYSGDTEDSGSVTWSNLNNGTYYFSQSVTIDNEVTIDAGAYFEMGTDVKLIVSGSTTSGASVIEALGSDTDPITFTGRSKAKGAWGGILISSSSVDNIMDHVLVEYGGGKDLATYMDAGNLGVYNEGYLTLSNSFIENSANYGVIIRTGRDAQLNKSNVSYSNNDNTDEYTY